MHYKNYLIKIFYFLEGLFFKKDTLCPYCLRSSYEIVFKKAQVINILHCLKCGLYWTSPIFRFYKFYDIIYEGDGLTTRILTKSELSEVLSSNFQATDKDYAYLIGYLKKYAKGKRLLEFGSSWGYFLYQARKEQFEVVGVEISEKRRRYARDNLKIRTVAGVDELISAGERYDIIVVFHVLEHLTSINRIFKNFNTLLNEEGILIIGVPFIDFNKKKDTFRIMGAVHPLGFCKKFFENNMPAEGFRVDFHNELIICTKTCFPPINKFIN